MTPELPCQGKVHSNFKYMLARIRQEGKGVWHIMFIVIGYDDEFEMHAPGRLSQDFAEKLTRATLAKALRMKIQHVIHKLTHWEAP